MAAGPDNGVHERGCTSWWRQRGWVPRNWRRAARARRSFGFLVTWRGSSRTARACELGLGACPTPCAQPSWGLRRGCPQAPRRGHVRVHVRGRVGGLERLHPREPGAGIMARGQGQPSRPDHGQPGYRLHQQHGVGGLAGAGGLRKPGGAAPHGDGRTVAVRAPRLGLRGRSVVPVSSVHAHAPGRGRGKPDRGPDGAGDVAARPGTHVIPVATKCGVVQIKGNSVWERAKALISVAHPLFRDELAGRARELRMAPAWHL